MKLEHIPSLSSLTTLHTGGKALAHIRLEQSEDCYQLPQLIKEIGGKPFVIGGGSNILFRDGELPLIIISTTFDRNISPNFIEEEEKDGTIFKQIEVSSALPIPVFLRYCIANGLRGLEGLAGIPGKIGGAICMNAGAFQCSTDNYLTELTIYIPEKGIITINKEAWTYSYRHFTLNFPCSYFIILSAKFSLPRTSSQEVLFNIKKKLSLKKNTQPITEWTAGCVFKNPKEDSAGRLLDVCGVKSMRKGNFFFSPIHANFLVHDKKGSCETKFNDAIELIEGAQLRVKKEFGIILEREVRIVI